VLRDATRAGMTRIINRERYTPFVGLEKPFAEQKRSRTFSNEELGSSPSIGLHKFNELGESLFGLRAAG
jgi:hypothetical protein